MQPVSVEKSNVTLGGVQGEKVKVTIAASKMVFDIMVRKIYSKGYETVVRELVSNAHDAHVMRYKDRADKVAIVITLPTMLDPVFRVRDFGPGMSHEFIMQNYSILGFSTKDGDNSQTGMFGIGSKSPLSVSDTFTLRIFDSADTVRIYTIDLNDDGINITHVFDTVPLASDKADLGGVEVSIPVKREDIFKITEGLKATHFCWFDKHVKFDGNTSELDELNEFVKVLPKFYCKKHDNEHSTAVPDYFIRQGSAVYPIDNTQIEMSDWLSVNELYKGHDIYFDMPLGTFDVTAARENILYNAESIQNIKAGLSKFLEDYRIELRRGMEVAGDYSAYVSKLRAQGKPRYMAFQIASFVASSDEIPDDRTLYTADYLLSHFHGSANVDENSFVLEKGVIINRATVSPNSFSLSTARFARAQSFDRANIGLQDIIVLTTQKNIGTIRNAIHKYLTSEALDRSDFAPGWKNSLDVHIVRAKPNEFGDTRDKIDELIAGTPIEFYVEDDHFEIVSENSDKAVAPKISQKRYQAPQWTGHMWGGVADIPDDDNAFYVVTGKGLDHLKDDTIKRTIEKAKGLNMWDSTVHTLWRVPSSRLEVVRRARPKMREFMPHLRDITQKRIDAAGRSVLALPTVHSFSWRVVKRLNAYSSLRELIKRDEAMHLSWVLSNKSSARGGNEALCDMARTVNATLPVLTPEFEKAVDEIGDDIQRDYSVLIEALDGYGETTASEETQINIIAQAYIDAMPVLREGRNVLPKEVKNAYAHILLANPVTS